MAASLRLALCAAALYIAAATKVQQVVLRKARAQSFVQALGDFKHKLRVCNAYPNTAALNVLMGKKPLSESPMPYKACEDFETSLKVGDRLSFKVAEAKGTFAVSDLPGSDATLLLVVYRQDTKTSAVAFESHIFDAFENAQVAVIDAYTGAAPMKLLVENTEKYDAPGKPHTEDLSFGTVVAMNSGKYNLLLQDFNVKQPSNTLMVADREHYVVLRVGVDAQNGPSFPEELVVYPVTKKTALHISAKSSAQQVQEKVEKTPGGPEVVNPAPTKVVKSGAACLGRAFLSVFMLAISWVQ